MAGIQPNGNGIRNENVIDDRNMKAGGNNGHPKMPYIEIVEQPASKALRFRYECEGRSAGSIPGVHNTSENKTYPSIRIVGYKGRAVIVVSCVTKDEPYRAHPHNLVGKEGCKNGICTMEINNESMTAVFSNLGIQCVKKKDIEDALKIREEIRVDPFRQGFAHSAHPSSIDLNAVRLCFQAFLDGSEPKKFDVLTPVVSDPIYDKKAMSDLIITKLSHSSASVRGGQEIILLCEKVAKEDIQVRFYEESNGQMTWEGFGDFTPSQVHKQVAIYFKTPPYKHTEVDRKIKVFIQLKRPSDGAMSDPLPFHFVPDDSGPIRKKAKLQEFSFVSAQQQQSVQNAVFRLSPQPVEALYGSSPQAGLLQPKEEPCPSPELPYRSPPMAATSPYDNSVSFTSPINYGQESNALPPFTNISRTNLPISTAASYDFQNFPNYPELALPPSLATYILSGSILTNESNMYPNNEQGNENQNRNDNAVISLELKLDSKDLVRNLGENECQIDPANLSENFSQSLIISDYNGNGEANNNMTDSLTRLANETVEKLCNRGAT